MLKLRRSRLKQAIAELGVEVLGPQALRWRETPPDGDEVAGLMVPDYLNSRSFPIFGGAQEVQLAIIAKSVVGI